MIGEGSVQKDMSEGGKNTTPKLFYKASGNIISDFTRYRKFRFKVLS